MRNLNANQVTWLEENFKHRVTVSLRERSMYSRDAGALPSLIRPLVGNTMPAAVVQPVSEEEVVKLVMWAGSERIPLVPRGKATSGYGGVLPVKGGIVVDFSRMTNVLAINGKSENEPTVAVEPGISWKKLDEDLIKEGLTLRLYPSSYPSSTAGGWLAQGGAGFGSWQYGMFAENIVEARAVLGDGRVKTFSGKELRFLSEAEGITGIIVSLTLKVMPYSVIRVKLIAVEESSRLVNLLELLKALPLWSVSFVNPAMVRLSNQAPLRTHHGHPVEERVTFPEKYLVTLAYRKENEKEIEAKLPDLAAKVSGQLLSEKLARHEWEERFKIMKVKRLGPSLIPAEVIVPLAGLNNLLEKLDASISQPLVLEGMGVSGKEIVILGFIPHDERRFSYNLTFPLALTVTRFARQNGGRAYATGLYFANEAPSVLGRERLQELKGFISKYDTVWISAPSIMAGCGKVSRQGESGFI
ncbi:MAG: FAD-binding oxidoreductase, partial [Spirochaetota bacterium]